MMKQTSSLRCDSYKDAVKLKAEAEAKAQKDFGGKAEEKWKARIKLRSVGHFDVTTHKFVPPPKKEQEKEKGSVAQQDRAAVS